MSAIVATLEDLNRLEAMLAGIGESQAALVELVERGIVPPLLVDEAEAIRLTSLSRTALRRLRAKGALRWYEVEGLNRYRRSELEEFIASLEPAAAASSASPTAEARPLRLA